MKPRIFGLSLLLAFALLAAVRLPLNPVQTAAASHFGVIECGEIGTPVSDGAIAPDEYDESHFDPATKILAYFTCDNSTERLLHVGILVPGNGWVGLEVQARDVWDGTLNEVRLARAASSNAVEAEDGLRNITLGSFTSDAALGGSLDVLNASVGTAGAANVYEFAVPLRSPDSADSQLQSNGPFYFVLEGNPYDSSLDSEARTTSDLQSLAVASNGTRGTWTGVELSLGPSDPTAESRVLVSLRDEQGYPLPAMALEVFADTTFGFLTLGSVVTNDQGVAEVTYAPRGNGTFVVGAAYAGGGGFLGSAAWRTLEVSAATGDGTLGSGLLDLGGALELRPVQAIIVVVVGSVWAAYAYALFVTRQMLRPKSPKTKEARPPANVWRWEK